jgi:hypothetical protein
MFRPSEIRIRCLLGLCYYIFLGLEYIEMEYTTYTHTHLYKKPFFFLVPLVPNLTNPYFTKGKGGTND